MCKIFENMGSMFIHASDHSKTQEMYKKAVEKDTAM